MTSKTTLTRELNELQKRNDKLEKICIQVLTMLEDTKETFFKDEIADFLREQLNRGKS